MASATLYPAFNFQLYDRHTDLAGERPVESEFLDRGWNVSTPCQLCRRWAPLNVRMARRLSDRQTALGVRHVELAAAFFYFGG